MSEVEDKPMVPNRKPEERPRPEAREEWEPQPTTRLPRFVVELPDEPAPPLSTEERPNDRHGG